MTFEEAAAEAARRVEGAFFVKKYFHNGEFRHLGRTAWMEGYIAAKTDELEKFRKREFPEECKK